MNAIRRDEEAIYHEARCIGDAEAREAYLRRACGDDGPLRNRVESLLRVCDQEPSFLEGLPYSATIEVPAVAEQPEMVIGSYTLREPIGEGGMGVVHVAEQQAPVRRTVAMKIIKPGMDTKQVIARFEAERQALAMMDHPNIARVFDSGMTLSGRPYFVMELVRGIPITEYCDREQLSIPERLELFVLVCRAVQHAHQKGVIHRDLKPSNILVTVIDGIAVPKVIDFGVAKAIGQTLTEKTLHTGIHQFIGTPLYMSPEQAELAGLDVDTRSDVYSLGVLLYELLTGTTPFDAQALKQVAFDEMRRIIREEEPPKPSARLGTLSETLKTISSNRGASPRRLDHSLRGELDWMVMKALEKDRRRRYESASDFAADVLNFLADRPVAACPPSAWARMGKYVRRNRGPLTTAGFLALALICGTIASTWLAIRAIRAERDAEARAGVSRREAVLQQLEGHLLTPHDQDWYTKASRLALEAAELHTDDRLQNTRLQQLAVATLAGIVAIPRRDFMMGARSVAFGPGGQVLMGGVSNASDFRQRLGTQLWDGSSILPPRDLGVAGEGPVGFRVDGTPLQFLVDVRTKVLSLVDLARGKTIHRFEVAGLLDLGDERLPYPAAMSPGGSIVAAGARVHEGRSAVIVWDGESGRVVRQFPARARCVSFSPDGALLAIGTDDGQVTIRSVSSGEQVAALDRDHCRINTVAFGRSPRIPLIPGTRPNLRRWQVAVGDNQGIVTVWELGSVAPRVRSIARGSPHQVYSLAFSPDGSLLASAGRYHVSIWDPAIGGDPLLQIRASQYVHALCFHPDGRRLLIGGEDAFGVPGRVQSLELVDGHGVQTLRGLSGPIERAVFSPDDSHVAAQSHEWQAAVWDRQTGRLKLVVDLPMGDYADNVGLAISPDNRLLAFASHTQARLWDVESGRELSSWTLRKGYQDAIGFHAPDRLRLIRVELADPSKGPGGPSASEAAPRVLSIYDLPDVDSRAPIRHLEEPAQSVKAIALSPLGTIALVDIQRGHERGRKRTVDAYDLTSGKPLWSLPSQAQDSDVGGLRFDPTGLFAVAWLGRFPQGAPLLEISSGRILGFLGPIEHLGPGATLGVGTMNEGRDRAVFVRGREQPLFSVHLQTAPLDLKTFSRDGQVILGNHPGGNAVTVCNLGEVQRHLTRIGLGW